ncbi:hypothetical protein F2P79_003233 [Pimephales promelas]|nr:hypothetical protein F2P79_003233 [Pimephales promelas]
MSRAFAPVNRAIFPTCRNIGCLRFLFSQRWLRGYPHCMDGGGLLPSRYRLCLGIPILCSYKAAYVPVWQGIKPGPVNDMVILSARPKERRLVEGATCIRGHQTADMRRGLDLEPASVEGYCRVKEVKHYTCGFLIHPDAPWMGSSPDGIVYDPKGPGTDVDFWI